jgi:tripartite-type tricarboxylate transporter receptor subunit TctC
MSNLSVRAAGRRGSHAAAVAVAFAVFTFAAAVAAQDFPARPLRMIVASGAGGGTDLAGRNDAMFDNLSAPLKHIESGRLKALAVSAPKRALQLPNVPTVNESGVTKFDGESWMGVFAPAATPAPVVEALRGLLLNVVRDAEYVARVEGGGGRVMVVPANQQQL